MGNDLLSSLEISIAVLFRFPIHILFLQIFSPPKLIFQINIYAQASAMCSIDKIFLSFPLMDPLFNDCPFTYTLKFQYTQTVQHKSNSPTAKHINKHKSRTLMNRDYIPKIRSPSSPTSRRPTVYSLAISHSTLALTSV